MSTQRMVGPDEPLMVAWKAFQATEGYENAMRWACAPDLEARQLEGSLWAAFSAGFAARTSALEGERDRLRVALNAMLADGELQRTDPMTFYYIRAALAATSAPARIPDEARRGWPDALSAGDVEPFEEQEAIEAAHENEATAQPDRGYRRWACTVMCLELGAELHALTIERAREVGRQAVDRLIRLYGYDSMEFAEGRALWHSMVIALGIGFDPAPGREGAAGNPRWDLRGTLADSLGLANDPRVQRAAGILGHIGAELAAPIRDGGWEAAPGASAPLKDGEDRPAPRIADLFWPGVEFPAPGGGECAEKVRLRWYDGRLIIAHPEHIPLVYDPATGTATALAWPGAAGAAAMVVCEYIDGVEWCGRPLPCSRHPVPPAIDSASVARELRADEAYDPGPSDERC